MAAQPWPALKMTLAVTKEHEVAMRPFRRGRARAPRAVPQPAAPRPRHRTPLPWFPTMTDCPCHTARRTHRRTIILTAGSIIVLCTGLLALTVPTLIQQRAETSKKIESLLQE